jgi:ferric-dicitrate binding protein FerR (iron transport regulator)
MSGEEPLDDVIAAYVEGGLDQVQRRRLAERIGESEELRERFVAQVRLHLGLATLLRHDAAEQALRRAALIAESFSAERQRQVIESARDLRPHRAAPSRRRRPAAALAAAALLAALGLGALAQLARPAPAEPVAQVAIAGAHAAIERAQATVPAAGAVLPGDIVMAGADERVELDFAGESTRIALRAGSRLQALGPPGKRFRLLEGAVAVAAGPQPPEHPLRIATPRAEVTVVGTAFTLACNPQMTWLDVEHGTVRIGAPGDQLKLQVGAGQRALATDLVRVVPSDHGSGLLGSYFDGDGFRRLALVRIDPVVDFDWQDRGADPAVERELFSVRWTGEIEPRYDEVYRFSIPSDDGARLWIDGRLVVDDWHIQSANYQRPASGVITLAAHRRVPIRLDYFEHEHLAAVRLEWESRSQPREVVPQACLYPNPP